MHLQSTPNRLGDGSDAFHHGIPPGVSLVAPILHVYLHTGAKEDDITQ